MWVFVIQSQVSLFMQQTPCWISHHFCPIWCLNLTLNLTLSSFLWENSQRAPFSDNFENYIKKSSFFQIFRTVLPLLEKQLFKTNKSWEPIIVNAERPIYYYVCSFGNSMNQETHVLTCECVEISADIVKTSIKIWEPDVSYSMHIVQLWVSVLISTYCNKLLWRNALIYGYSDSIQSHFILLQNMDFKSNLSYSEFSFWCIPGIVFMKQCKFYEDSRSEEGQRRKR